MKNIVCIKELFESKEKALQPANHPHILRIILLGVYTIYMQNFKMTPVSYITPWGIFTLFRWHFLTLLTSDSFCGTRNQCPIFRYLKSVRQMLSLVITCNISFLLISEIHLYLFSWGLRKTVISIFSGYWFGKAANRIVSVT